jgi:dihydroorotase
VSAALVLKGGRVIDPSQGLDGVTDVAFADGRVVATGDGLIPTRLKDHPFACPDRLDPVWV